MAQYRLSNALVSFTFDTDPTTGLKLTSFKRAQAAQIWLNAETNLWKATVFDTTSATPFTPTSLTPTAAVTINQFGSILTAAWAAEAVGPDVLRVTVTCTLGASDDWLQTRISAAWVSSPTTYALDSIGALPLQIAPLNNPNDFACMSNVFGILSEDPITNLRYAAPGQTLTFGNGTTTNTWNYPSGRGNSMPVWGYYENTSHEGWMTWAENWSLNLFSVRFESDATRMVWEAFEPQEDHVLVGNNGRTLGSDYTFCLRPLRTTQDHGWWDIARHYRQRLEASPPGWLPAKRIDRVDLSATERAYTVFVDFNISDNSHVLLDGKPGDLAGLMDSMRTAIGDSTVPIQGVMEAPSYGLSLVGEDPDGDLHAKVLDLYQNKNCFISIWREGMIEPKGWSINRWDQVIGDSAELRWWTSNDVVGAIRMSRKGYLAGNGVDRLNESATRYYRERNFPITAWDSGTKIVSVTGNPSTSGFIGDTLAILIPASGAARLASAIVSVLGSSSVTVTTDFLDALGNVVVPTAADTLEIVTRDTNRNTSSVVYCRHAAYNSSFFSRLTINTTAGMFDSVAICGRYLDAYTDPQMSSPTPTYDQWCYRDHSAWSKISPGYIAHPLGGGTWYQNAKRDYVNGLKSAGRARQIVAGKVPFYVMSCEDIDETLMDGFDFCWHNVSAGQLFRNTTSVDPTTHKYKTVPMWSVVHAGRTMGRALNQELSTAIGNTTSPFNDPALHATMGYFLSEWVYGITHPTLSFFESDTVNFIDLFDDTIYSDVTPGGVSLTVKSLKNLWLQIHAARSWLPEYMPYGEFLAPAKLDLVLAEVTTGRSQTTYTTTYYSYDTIYERATFPRVTHGCWRSAASNVCVVMINWTDTAATWSGTLDTSTFGLGEPGSIALRKTGVTLVDANHKQTTEAITLDRNTGKLTVVSIPAFSVRAALLVPEGDVAESFYFNIDARPNSRPWKHLKPRRVKKAGGYV